MGGVRSSRDHTRKQLSDVWKFSSGAASHGHEDDALVLVVWGLHACDARFVHTVVSS